MGRWAYKTESESLVKTDVYDLRKKGFLKTGQYAVCTLKWTNYSSGNPNSIDMRVSAGEFGEYVQFIYTETDRDGEKTNFDYKARLVKTPCHFGGFRYWFVCPLSCRGISCNRRVAKLYLDGSWLGCRHCHNITYRSRRESKKYAIFKYIDLVDSASEEKEKLKRHYYAGKPTKKYRRILNKIGRSEALVPLIYNKEHLKDCKSLW
ncbi:hypothetical protein KKA27_03435 [Patescibacteria group bacterium]|nr:hypothetical protein [Patescibacteria group bacterium]